MVNIWAGSALMVDNPSGRPWPMYIVYTCICLIYLFVFRHPVSQIQISLKRGFNGPIYIWKVKMDNTLGTFHESTSTCRRIDRGPQLVESTSSLLANLVNGKHIQDFINLLLNLTISILPSAFP